MTSPKYVKFVRDTVHDYVGLTDPELKIISTSIFQRLRHIRQTSTASLTYPGATHTRFEHSLGTMHIAGSIAERIVPSPGFESISSRAGAVDPSKIIQRVRISALLHDLGHPAFSHICEPILEEALLASPDKEEFLSLKSNGMKPAEYATAKLTENWKETFGLGPEEVADVLNIFNPHLKRKGGALDEPILLVLHQIISSQLDADRLDYISRDTYSAGLEFGKLDIDRIVQNAEIYQNSIVFPGKTVSAIEAVLVQRLWLYRRLVYHHAVKVTDYMLEKCISFAAKYEKSGICSDQLCINDFHYSNYVMEDSSYFCDSTLTNKLISFFTSKVEDPAHKAKGEWFFTVYNRGNMPIALWKSESDYLAVNELFTSHVKNLIEPEMIAKRIGNKDELLKTREKFDQDRWLQSILKFVGDEEFGRLVKRNVMGALKQVTALSEVMGDMTEDDILLVRGGRLIYEPLKAVGESIQIVDSHRNVISLLKASALISSIAEKGEPFEISVYLRVPLKHREHRELVHKHVHEINGSLPRQFGSEIQKMLSSKP